MPVMPGGCFLWVNQNFAFQFIYWGTTNPEGVTMATQRTCLGGQLARVNDGNGMARKTNVGASST